MVRFFLRHDLLLRATCCLMWAALACGVATNAWAQTDPDHATGESQATHSTRSTHSTHSAPRASSMRRHDRHDRHREPSAPALDANAGAWLGYRPAPRGPSAKEANAPAPQLPFYAARRGRTTLYLLGALHAGYPADYPARHPFRPAIRRALDSAAVVAFELSPDEMIDAPADVQRLGYCGFVCLPGLITPSLWRKVAARVGMNPALLAQVGKMRPWLAAMVMESYDSMSSGLQIEYGSEAQIENIYVKGRIVGLETLREQMSAFDKLTLAEQREMLEQDLAQSPQQNAADLRRVHALWRAGDAERLYEWQQTKSERLWRSKTLSEQIDERILYQRNLRFVSRMLALAEPRKPVFVTIGALHLGGRRGVLALLRQSGYRVQRL